jgi:hypothetical protein
MEWRSEFCWPWLSFIRKYASGWTTLNSACRVGYAMYQKVYRADWQRRKFPGHLIHALAAAAQEPFWTTGAKRQFPLGLLGITSCLPVTRDQSRESSIIGCEGHFVVPRNLGSIKTLGCFSLTVGITPALRTPLWLASGWECRDRRLSRGQKTLGSSRLPFSNLPPAHRPERVGAVPTPLEGN